MPAHDRQGSAGARGAPRMNVRRIVFGSAMMTGGHAFRIGLQFLLLPFLAVQLGPTSYGLAALTMPVVFFAVLLSSGGLGAGLIRRIDVSADVESTVFWFSLTLGCGLACLLLIMAAPISVLLGEPRVAALLRALSPIVILSSLCTVPQARLSRTGRLPVFATSDLASALGGMAAAFFGAWHGWGAWSLIAQQLVLWSIKFGIVFAASRLRPRCVLELGELRVLLGFGIHLVGSNMVDFCTRNADVYVINLSAGVRDLGYYALAIQIVRLPDTVLAGPMFASLFPILAAANRDVARTARLYLAALRTVALVACPALLGLGEVAKLLVATVLGAQWGLTGTLLAVLVPVGLTKCLGAVNSALFLAAGRSDMVLRLQLASSGVAIAGIAAGARFGVTGVAFGYAVASLATLPIGFVVAARMMRIPAGRIAAIFGPPLVATLVMVIGVETTIGALRPDVRPVVLLAIGVAAGAALYGATLAAVGGRQLYAHLKTLRASQ